MYDHFLQTALALTTFAVFALGVTYASVPLYKMFCQVLCHIIRLNIHLTAHLCKCSTLDLEAPHREWMLSKPQR